MQYSISPDLPKIFSSLLCTIIQTVRLVQLEKIFSPYVNRKSMPEFRPCSPEFQVSLPEFPDRNLGQFWFFFPGKILGNPRQKFPFEFSPEKTTICAQIRAKKEPNFFFTICEKSLKPKVSNKDNLQDSPGEICPPPPPQAPLIKQI